jgi:hypothetical protein
MEERREELSTADLASQPSGRAAASERADRADDLERQDEVTDDEAAGAAVGEPAAQGRSQAAPDLGTRPDELPAEGDRREAEAADADVQPTAAGARAATATPEASTTGAAAPGPLLASQDAETFRARWTDVQNGFVDAPRRAVEAADALVAEVMQHLAKTFADERSGLEAHWDRGDDVSTEDLRTAFQRYRSFFERLLST